MNKHSQDEDVLGHYEYGLLSKHGAGLYAIGFLITFLFLEIFVKDSPRKFDLVALAWWGWWITLIVLFLIAERYMRIRLESVTVRKDGLRIPLLQKSKSRFPIQFDFWPQKKVGFLKWTELETVEFFRWPDPDAQKMAKRGGIRFVAGEKRMVVWEHIKGYDDFCQKVEAQLQEYAKDRHFHFPLVRRRLENSK